MNGNGNAGKTRWKLDDLVAFECALAKDDGQDWASLKAQDAATQIDADALASGKRRPIAASWLAARLEAAPEIRLAADSVMQSIRAAGQLLGTGGALLGLASATAALAYTGDAPINVSAFFGVFVLLQAFFAALLLLVFLLPRSWRERAAFGPLFRFSRWIYESLSAWLQRLAARFLSGQQRQDAAEWAAAARRSLILHGKVAKWVAFTKLQAAAIFFNVGILLALLAAVAFSDRAFAWQSTLEVEDRAVHQLVSAVATPWSWYLGEGEGYPSETQIAGSRIVLKEGIQTLDSDDLAVWWQFLALGVLIYGLLPRLLFYGLGKLQTASALRRYDFGNAAVERLMNRLLQERDLFATEEVEQGADRGHGALASSDAADALRKRVHCLCSRELAEAFDSDAIQRALSARWKMSEDAVTMEIYHEGDMTKSLDTQDGATQFAVVFESWMPPIREIERQIKQLRRSLDERTLIKLVLLGIPATDESVSLRPDAQYAAAWHSFVQRLGDPYLILENPAAQ